jgi:hypothetical protein
MAPYCEHGGQRDREPNCAAVTTINTPMPRAIDERTLLGCLKGEISERKWRIHVQALFDEVDVRSSTIWSSTISSRSTIC